MIDLKIQFPRMFSLIEDTEFSERENHAIYAMWMQDCFGVFVLGKNRLDKANF